MYSTTNAKKVGQSIRSERFNKALASTLCENKSAAFETDSASQSFFIQIFRACTSYGISSLSPKAKEKKEVCKTMCDRKGENSRFGINPLFYLRDCIMLPTPRRRPANITNQSRCCPPVFKTFTCLRGAIWKGGVRLFVRF